MEYRPTFDIDGTLYFSDALERGALTDSLSRHIAHLKQILSRLETHRKETLDHIPKAYRTSADIIFEHHIHHYEAELDWAEQSLNRLKEDDTNGEG
ncbi:MAG TPA: hypothetical protein VN370_12200 [Desulfitobacteriaceae bacterium]|nr:hypothetical protein [Desulfitobacteriaceae bacterium]